MIFMSVSCEYAFIYLFAVSRQGLIFPKLALSSQCRQECSGTLDPPVSSSQVLV